ncbi:tRNA dimethylallyltransferase [Rhizoctonia solani]|uniref:tRNA dimethylallyltransferase n=1 Tax=Rhizoctonia solani TaxID=456999 RepID=A0A8H8PA13_9AGAM|nr:tRNA dimethylallyltransferase [Rhizoctonia solani]QRW27345.1 tRNA dimethylallyltransferase [Rhizoctonia solani]
MTQNSPLVAVVGSTGTGKSRLSIELAIALRAGIGSVLGSWKNSKIINADAMQVYKGLDLVTNKVTESEMNGIEHTLFDFRDLDHEYVITEWVTDATAEISTAHANNQLPIVVGGTTYWVQHLLFANGLTSLKDSIHDPVHESSISTSLIDLPSSLQQLFNNLPPRGDGVDETMAFDLHNLLSHLDPVTATRWHWKDTRKMPMKHNSILFQGKYHATFCMHYQRIFRYPAIVFWLYMDPNHLNPILDARIDKMVELGLKNEIEAMRKVISSAENRGQMTGLNQAIGSPPPPPPTTHHLDPAHDPFLHDPSRSLRPRLSHAAQRCGSQSTASPSLPEVPPPPRPRPLPPLDFFGVSGDLIAPGIAITPAGRDAAEVGATALGVGAEAGAGVDSLQVHQKQKVHAACLLSALEEHHHPTQPIRVH